MAQPFFRNLLKVKKYYKSQISPIFTQTCLYTDSKDDGTKTGGLDKKPPGPDIPSKDNSNHNNPLEHDQNYSYAPEKDYNRVKSNFSKLVRKINEAPFSGKYKKNPVTNKYFPVRCDILIIGGGIVGTSIAFHLKELCGKGVHIVIVDKDHKFEKSSTALSCGGIRQQFSLPENIRLSQYGFSFLQKIKQRLAIEGESPPEINLSIGGYLTLASEEGTANLLNNFSMQKELGSEVIFLSRRRLKERFPWLGLEGVEAGVYGIHGEGWFDPWSLQCALTRKCNSMGVDFIEAEVVGGDIDKFQTQFSADKKITKHNSVNSILLELPDGGQHSIECAYAVIAAGCWSGGVGYALGIGEEEDDSLLSIPLPIEPRKRYVYVVKPAETGPGLHCPFVMNTDGSYFRRDGLGDLYLCGASPTEEEEPSVDDLTVDDDFFERRVWPFIAKRVKQFESLKVKSSWAGYYDYNTFDQNGFVGPHPCYRNLYVAAGFSGHGLQHAPGVGLAISDHITRDYYKYLDLERLGFERLFFNDKLKEDCIY